MDQILFWEDKWLDGKRIQDIAPLVYALVPKRSSRRTVLEALTGEKWTEDIQGEIGSTALIQYLELWDILNGVELNEQIPDKHIWRLSSLNLMRESRNPSPSNAIFSCGLPLIIDVGQRTDWQRGGSLIQISAFYVIKRRRTFNIFLWVVYSQETFGSPSYRALVLQHLLLNLLTNPLIIGGEKLTVLLVETLGWD